MGRALKTRFQLADSENYCPNMVQIKIAEAPKPESECLTSVNSTVPSSAPEVQAVRVVSRQRASRCYGLYVFLFFMLGISFLATVKRLCDYKEQNLRLRQELALERQKDAVLKEAVRSNVPEAKFGLLSRVPAWDIDVEVPGEEETPGWFSVNLMVLWSSPRITPCDMAQLSHLLAMEIYHHKEVIHVLQAESIEAEKEYYSEDDDEDEEEEEDEENWKRRTGLDTLEEIIDESEDLY